MREHETLTPSYILILADTLYTVYVPEDPVYPVLLSVAH